MDNFTPLKVEKKKRKINKFLIFGNLFLVVLIAAIGIFYYNRILVSRQQKAVTPGEHCCFQGGDDTASPCSEAMPGHKTQCPDNWKCNKQNNGYGDCVPPDGGQDGGGGQKCPNGQPPICDKTSTQCSRPAGCQFPKQLVIPLEKCGQPDDLTFMCYQNCTCESATPTPTPTSPQATNTPTPTPTQPTATNTPTPTRTPTPTPTPTGTIVPSNTPTVTPTGTIVPSNTPTVTPTTPPGEPTNTPGPTATPTPTDVPGAPTATPTEIILAQTTVTSPPVPVTGMVQSFMYLIPALIMLVGLIL